MKKISILQPFSIFLSLIILSISCNYRTVEGSDVLSSISITVDKAKKIHLKTFCDVELTPGATMSVKVEGDDNIIPLIIVKERDGSLVIESKRNVNIQTKQRLVVKITMPLLESVQISGSGNVIGTAKFIGANQLKTKINGSGNIELLVNTPKVTASIHGSGNITLSGETEQATVTVKGSGNYLAKDLKTENTIVEIHGSGDAKLFADTNLDIKIFGSGNVYYAGNAAVTKKIDGSGDVVKQ
jgi:Putative auto-transporter adhesin, head GIN domain